MTKTLAALTTVLALSALTLGCASAAPNDDGASSSSDELATKKKPKDPLAAVVTTTTIDVAVTNATLGNDMGTVHLDMPELWKYTKLARFPRLFFEVPPRDGASCDDACTAAIVARAKTRGGKLTGKLTVTRSYGDLHRPDGTCVRVLQESVELDLQKATHGISPDIEEAYGFLTLTDSVVPSVELHDIPCP